MPLPTDFTNATASTDTHPDAHNATNTTVNTLETAVGRLPKGELAAVTTSGTVTTASSITFSTASLTMTGRKIRVIVLLVASGTASAGMNIDVSAPGVTAISYSPTNYTTGVKQQGATYVIRPTGNGIVTCVLSTVAAQTFTVDPRTTMVVDDVGAV